jgi:hypothetical protein
MLTVGENCLHLIGLVEGLSFLSVITSKEPVAAGKLQNLGHVKLYFMK